MRPHIVLQGRLLKQDHRLLVILLQAFAVQVHQPEVELRIGLALVGRFPESGCGSGEIFLSVQRHAVGEIIGKSQGDGEAKNGY